MRVTLLSWGSRGDVGPMAYLGTELQRRGHPVRILVPPDLLALPAALGLAASAVGPAAAGERGTELGRRWRADPGEPQVARELLERLRAGNEESADAAVEACGAADLVVANFYFEGVSTCVAEATGVTVAFLHTFPWQDLPGAAVDDTSAPPAPGRRPDPVAIRHHQRSQWRLSRGDVTGVRRRLGLPPTATATSRRAEELGVLTLQGVSPSLVSGLAGSSPARPLTGSLLPAAADVAGSGEQTVDAALLAWLRAGPPPLFVGFGSMFVLTAAWVAMARRIAGACGLRLLLLPGWSEVGPLPPGDDLFVADAPTDLAQVLPHCAVAVHHGGAGTLTTACRAAVPSVVCSVLGDQPFWGDVVVRRGIGTHQRFAEVTETGLAECVRHALGADVRRRVAALADAMLAEPPGVPRAVDLLEAYVREPSGALASRSADRR